jgi:hypothetical protein
MILHRKDVSNEIDVFYPSFLVTVLISLTVQPDPLFSQGDFFRGKTITIIQDRDPGGRET